MRTADFHYELPDDLIAQAPAVRRDGARLLVYRRAAARTEHRTVADLPSLLAPGDLVVVNDTRVRRARLLARRASGGRVECLLVERVASADAAVSAWRALCRPAAKLRAGEILHVPSPTDFDGPVAARVRAVERELGPSGGPTPYWRVELLDPSGAAPADEEALIEAVGRLPLPPYVERDDGPTREEDARRYQTVYASSTGAVAAPTAGLHLSEALLARFAARGIDLARVTLHVGPGTFRPVEVDDPREHPMHAERYRVGREARAAIERARARGGRVVAVGTTVVRTLAAARDADGLPRVGSGSTDLFVHPGAEAARRLDAIDALVTNFHLPRSTLLMLVAALVGTERTLALYAEAIERRYRFYSYGDAMLVLP